MTLAPRYAHLGLIAALAFATLAPGCSRKAAEPRPEPAAAPAEASVTEVAPRPAAPSAPAAPAAPVASGGVPAGFPPACVAYAAMIDRLATCDKIGDGRAGLTRGYDELRDAWATVAPAQRAAIDAQCKTQADSLRNAVAATCGW